jgi:hypothetical protein
MAALIEILRNQREEHPKRNWDELEDHVRYVYEHMLTMGKIHTMVTRDVKITGQRGLQHQVDVYYEFERAGIWHRVAIECKNKKRPLEIGDVSRVALLQNDSPGLICVIVSASGYQSGAIQAAEGCGIIPLSLDDLPSIGEILADRLEDSTIPGEDAVGEPFWTIYELIDGEIDGTMYAPQERDGYRYAHLFLSKKSAEAFLAYSGLTADWIVRGLRQRHLLAFIPTVDVCAGRFLLISPSENKFGKPTFTGIEIPREDLIDEFCLTHKEELKIPSVAPPYQALQERKLREDAKRKSTR